MASGTVTSDLQMNICTPTYYKSGLQGQYFVAHDLFKDLDAHISHGRKEFFDVTLFAPTTAVAQIFCLTVPEPRLPMTAVKAVMLLASPLFC